MYPDVFKYYAKDRRQFSPVDVLPTSTFFYAMKQGEEIIVDLEAVKTLNLSCQATGETDDEGNIKVFFELNGQPRTVKVSNKHMVANIEKHPKADEANPNLVPAPMPRMIASIAVTQGKHVEAGDLLVTIEAMKMEIAICAEQSEIIACVVAGAGTQVDAKDLILEFEGKQGVCKLVLQDKNRYECGE